MGILCYYLDDSADRALEQSRGIDDERLVSTDTFETALANTLK